MRQYQHLAKDSDSLYWAIIFHDCVYDARRSDNEARSAQRAARALRGTDVHLPTVLRLIHSTQYGAQLRTSDERLLQQIDYGIFGAPRAAYVAYAQGVRQEFAHVPDGAFVAGRRAFLQSLGPDGPFRLAPFRARFGARARSNIAWELRALQAPDSERMV